MSATRDPSQKVGFVYSNLYHLYKKGVQEAKKAPGIEQPGLTSSHIKTSQVIKAYQPQVFSSQRHQWIPERKPTPGFLYQKKNASLHPGVEDLRKNLAALEEVHGRIRVLLNELKEITDQE
jgi:hypothetical protein